MKYYTLNTEGWALSSPQSRAGKHQEKPLSSADRMYEIGANGACIMGVWGSMGFYE